MNLLRKKSGKWSNYKRGKKLPGNRTTEAIKFSTIKITGHRRKKKIPE